MLCAEYCPQVSKNTLKLCYVVCFKEFGQKKNSTVIFQHCVIQAVWVEARLLLFFLASRHMVWRATASMVRTGRTGTTKGLQSDSRVWIRWNNQGVFVRFVLLCFFACLLIGFHMERAQDRKEEGKTAEGGAAFSDSNPHFLFYCLFESSSSLTCINASLK